MKLRAQYVLPSLLAFSICKVLGIREPKPHVQVWDPKTRQYYTQAIESR